MKKNNTLRTVLCLVLLLALMAGGTLGLNALTAPVIEANRKALLGDAVLIYDRADPAASELTVAADTVQSVYKDDTKQVYTVHLSTSEGYSHGPIVLTLLVDYEGRIVSLNVDSSADDKDLGEAFLPSFEGQDSALAGVELVAGVTFSSSAIKSAVNDGMEALISNGLITAGQKSDEQLLAELIAQVYPGIVNAAGAVQGEEIQPDGRITGGYKAANGSGFALFMDNGGEKLLAAVTGIGGARFFTPEGAEVTDAVDPALTEEALAFAAANADDLSAKQLNALTRLLPEGAELTPAEIPGLCGCVTGAYTAETEDGTLYAFAARPYGYSNEIMEFYYVLDESGAIVSWRAGELILHSEYFSDYQLDEAAYKEGFIGLTGESYTGEQALITGATMTSTAVDTAVRDVFEAFGLLTENRG